mmetsp:Transcript_2853/g.4499  ORF Transcript_2853/g.4499 Transcript_2853/m.4499 type:complete len:213 (+) Transcript_2853:370-1008(+)
MTPTPRPTQRHIQRIRFIHHARLNNVLAAVLGQCTINTVLIIFAVPVFCAVLTLLLTSTESIRSTRVHTSSLFKQQQQQPPPPLQLFIAVELPSGPTHCFLVVFILLGKVVAVMIVIIVIIDKTITITTIQLHKIVQFGEIRRTAIFQFHVIAVIGSKSRHQIFVVLVVIRHHADTTTTPLAVRHSVRHRVRQRGLHAMAVVRQRGFTGGKR